MINKDLCDRFILIMKKLNFTQKEYANKLSITESRVSDIKKYRLELSKTIIKKLVLEYKVNYNWLLEGIGEIFYNNVIKEHNDEKEKKIQNLDISLTKNNELEKTLLVIAQTNNTLVENYQIICDKLLKILESSKK